MKLTSELANADRARLIVILNAVRNSKLQQISMDKHDFALVRMLVRAVEFETDIPTIQL